MPKLKFSSSWKWSWAISAVHHYSLLLYVSCENTRLRCPIHTLYNIEKWYYSSRVYVSTQNENVRSSWKIILRIFAENSLEGSRQKRRRGHCGLRASGFGLLGNANLGCVLLDFFQNWRGGRGGLAFFLQSVANFEIKILANLILIYTNDIRIKHHQYFMFWKFLEIAHALLRKEKKKKKRKMVIIVLYDNNDAN